MTEDLTIQIENNIVDVFERWLPFVELRNINVERRNEAKYVPKQADRVKVEAMLDKLLEVTKCSHKILLCSETGSGCLGEKDCKLKAHINCDCPLESKVPVMELRWLAAQRAKTGEKSGMMMLGVDKVETARQEKAAKRKAAEEEAELKRKK